MFKSSLKQKLLVKKTKAKMSALRNKQTNKLKTPTTTKTPVPHWRIWGFVALLNLLMVCLFMCSFLRTQVAKPALKSCADITLLLSSAEVLCRSTSFPIMQKGTAGVCGEDFSQVHHLEGWCSLSTSQQFWQEMMAMSFDDNYQYSKTSKAPGGWMPLEILPGQQLFCNSNG